MPTYDFHLARNGEMFASSYAAEDKEGAQALALADVNRAWRESCADFDDLVADSDGHSLYKREDAEMLALYRALADGLSEMVEEERLIVPDDDYAWLVDTLAGIAAADTVNA